MFIKWKQKAHSLETKWGADYLKNGDEMIFRQSSKIESC